MENTGSLSEANVLESLEDLQVSLEGELFTPQDEGYDAARMGWNVAFQHKPAVVVAARSEEDIVSAVRYAAGAGLGVAVQSTGHGGILPADDNMLIITSALDSIQVDASAQTAQVGAGVKWGAVLGAAQEHGLAPLLGSSPTVGVVGYSLGGGFGWLARKHGIAADSLLAIHLVTADGRELVASAHENSDLFWAMRGGGGGFGVVTALEMKLYPVSQVFGGTLLYPVELAGEVLKRYREWTIDLPEEWTTSVKLANFPPVEMLPEFMRGKSFVMVHGCYCGPVVQGEAYLRDWLDWDAHIQNSFQVMPFSEVASISQDPQDPVPATHNGGWLAEFNDEAIQTILKFATPQDGPCPLTITEVRHVGGAVGRVSEGENAYEFRSGQWLLDIVAFVPSPEIHAAVKGHLAAFKGALAPQLADGVYMNFLDGEEAHQMTGHAFGGQKFERLTEIKTRYDPGNLFRFGYRIEPA